MVQVCLGCCGHPRRTRSECHPRARRLVELWIESPSIRPGCWWDDQGGRRLDRSGCRATRMRAGHPSGHWTTKGQAWAQRERPGRRIQREKYRITNHQSEMHIIYICYCLQISKMQYQASQNRQNFCSPTHVHLRSYDTSTRYYPPRSAYTFFHSKGL